METKFIEASQNLATGLNHGKFIVARFTEVEWAEPTRLDESASPRSLIRVCGWHRSSIWVMDLATGEAALFTPGGMASADLNKTCIHVCVLFEPFLEWLYEHIRAHPQKWWDELPRTLELPHAPGGLYGYRRTGAADSAAVHG